MINSRQHCLILYGLGFSTLLFSLVHFIFICIDLSDVRITDAFIHMETFFGWMVPVFLFGYWFFRLLFDRHRSGRHIIFYVLSLLMAAYSALFISGRIVNPPSAGLWIVWAVGCAMVIVCWILSKMDTAEKIRITISVIIGISYSLLYALSVYLLDSVIAFWPMTILYFIVIAALIGIDLHAVCWPLPRAQS